jgi:hypothetical protein
MGTLRGLALRFFAMNSAPQIFDAHEHRAERCHGEHQPGPLGASDTVAIDVEPNAEQADQKGGKTDRSHPKGTVVGEKVANDVAVAVIFRRQSGPVQRLRPISMAIASGVGCIHIAGGGAKKHRS